MSFSETLQPYLDDLAAGTPAPGGGSAAAATGAMAAALTAMVCRLTIGRKKYLEVDLEMRSVLARLEELRTQLTQLVSEDPVAYTAVMDAYRLPEGTTEEQTVRQAAIQAATKQATLTPLATARACAEIIRLSRIVTKLGNPNAAGDAAAGAACAQAGLKIAVLDAQINLKTLEDAAFVADCRTQLVELLPSQAEADELHELVGQAANEASGRNQDGSA
jgi:formiminotetrahydrofolate cyclodeaminase